MYFLHVILAISIVFSNPAFSRVDASSALASGVGFAVLQAFCLALGIRHLLAGEKKPYGFRWGWSVAFLLIFGGSVAVSTLSRTGDIAESLVAGVGVGVVAGLIGVAIDAIASVTWRKPPSAQGVASNVRSVMNKTRCTSQDRLTQTLTGGDLYSDLDYQQVAEEIDRQKFDKGLWLKAKLKVNSNDPEKIQMEYAKLRLEQLSKSSPDGSIRNRDGAKIVHSSSLTKINREPQTNCSKQSNFKASPGDRKTIELQMMASSINAENLLGRLPLVEEELIELLKSKGYRIFRVPGGRYRVEYNFQIVPCESSLVSLRAVLETHEWRKENY